MSTEKPSRAEDEYFAKQDAELLKRQQELAREKEAEAERKTHYMKCPKDGYDLTTTTQHGVQLDVCTHCEGIWLDHGELEQLMGQDDSAGTLKRVISDVMAALGRGRAAKEPS